MQLRKPVCALLTLPLLLGFSACGGKGAGSIKDIGDSCN